MKKITLILLTISLLLGYSCKPSYYYDHPHYYLITLDIQDLSGTEILKNIPMNKYYDDYGDYYGGVILRDLYTVEAIYPNGVKAVSHRELELDVMPLGEKNKDYIFFMVCNPDHPSLMNMISYKVTFPSLFGDNEEHIIDTYWELIVDETFVIDDKVGKYFDRPHRVICYKMTIDGKDVPVSQEPLYIVWDGKEETEKSWANASLAKIVLNK